MKEKKFAGDKKLPMTSLLARPERKFIDYWVPRFPRCIEGYHLTLSTIFLQYIELLDRDGFSGNFLDAAGRYLSSEAAYLPFENIDDSDTKGLFLRNQEIPARLM